MSATTTRLALLALASPFILPAAASAHIHPDEFAPSAFIEAPETVDCTLEDGSEAQCHRITVGYLPEGLEIGPFCPATLDDVGGIWDWDGENAGLYRVDRAFLIMLDELGYRFFDEDGTVHVVDIATQRPGVDHACINVSADESVEITMLLPVNPVMAETPAMLGVVGKVGVSLDGVPIFSDAPSVLMTGHMPALDTCGGHIDPGGWYHRHATSTDLDTVFESTGVAAHCTLEQDSSAQFGYAFDGFPMFGSTEADGYPAIDLDDCNGHVGMTVLGETYHYHASEDFPNLPACLVGVQAQNNFSTTATAGIGATRAGQDGRNEPPRPMNGGPMNGGPRGGPGGPPPGFEQAAESLGITPQALMEALGDPRGGRPDLAAAAVRLGITEGELRAALPPPPGR
ncbi:YHYH protein [Maricaulis sp.]|uniref:YHYH protein n=1 Tax=Maricaulis sp. TaxID=1486257 RepID=UPI003A93C20A